MAQINRNDYVKPTKKGKSFFDTEKTLGDEYQRFRLLRKDVFVPVALDLNYSPKKSASDGKVITVSALLGIFFFALFVWQIENLEKLLPVNRIIIYIVYWLIAAIIMVKVITKICFNSQEAVRKRNLEMLDGFGAQFKDIWDVKPGTLKEEHSGNLETVTYSYSSTAIVLRGIMRGIIDCEDDSDQTHYASLGRMRDICNNYDYYLHTYDVRYNPLNDNIWADESDKIAEGEFSRHHRKVRNALAQNIREFTKANSTVTVRYFIIRQGVAPRCSPTDMCKEIMKWGELSRLQVQGVTMNEFKSLVEQYYGLTISFENINEGALGTVDLDDTKVLKVIYYDGRVEEVNEGFKPKMPNVFITLDNSAQLIQEIHAEKGENKQHKTTYIV